MGHHSPSDFNISTQITQLGRDTSRQAGFVNAPIYRGSTVVFPTVDDLEHNRAEFNYGTMGTPTIASLENAWSVLAGAAGTVLSPSGLGAISLALLTTLKAGDHLLMPDSVYRPTRNFCAGMLAKMGIETTYYDPLIGAEIASLFRANTTTLFLESPARRALRFRMFRR